MTTLSEIFDALGNANFCQYDQDFNFATLSEQKLTVFSRHPGRSRERFVEKLSLEPTEVAKVSFEQSAPLAPFAKPRWRNLRGALSIGVRRLLKKKSPTTSALTFYSNMKMPSSGRLSCVLSDTSLDHLLTVDHVLVAAFGFEGVQASSSVWLEKRYRSGAGLCNMGLSDWAVLKLPSNVTFDFSSLSPAGTIAKKATIEGETVVFPGVLGASRSELVGKVSQAWIKALVRYNDSCSCATVEDQVLLEKMPLSELPEGGDSGALGKIGDSALGIHVIHTADGKYSLINPLATIIAELSGLTKTPWNLKLA